ncbi:hypothetical protein JOM56_009671 [Amanita muscaria]
MLRSVATKIAHNSTIPALAGNGDLRPLQDLITAEKSVLLSLQRLSADFEKSSELLRTWGVGEGDDLGDTLNASANILTHFSSALTQYASHGHRMRDQMKAIRTREEALDDLKRRRRTVMSNADAAEKKLSKMSPEHKNLEQQQDTLNRLRNEIRSLDGDILAEETSLSDFKRTQTKTMMGLKFGGLLECCEKGIIAGEYGKLVIAEIPEETTPPGVPRSIYQGQRRTEEFVAEANRCVSDVVLSTTAPLRTPNQEYFPLAQAGEAGAWAQNDAQAPGSTNSSRFLSTPQGLGDGRFIEPSSPSIPFPMPAVPQETRDGLKRRSIDDFGTAAWDSPGAAESRFHTYPPRLGPSTDVDIRSDDPLLLHSRHEAGTSFSASINEALTTIGNRGTGVRASEDLPAPPSYEAQELEELHHHPGRDRHLESSYDDLQASQRHSAYSGELAQLAYLAGADDRNMPYQSGDRNQGNFERPQRISQSQSAPDASTGMKNTTIHAGSSRAIPIVQSGSQKRLSVRRSEEEERALDAAAAREIGREMEDINDNRNRSDSFPRSVHSDENSLRIGADNQGPVQREPSPLAPPVPPFARRSISPRPSFDRFPASTSLPSLGQSNSQKPMNLGRKNVPTYDQSSPELPPVSTRFDNPYSSQWWWVQQVSNVIAIASWWQDNIGRRV